MKAKAEVKEEDHTPVKELFLRYKKSIITVIGLLVGSSATYYILITYMPTYISQFMGTSFSSAFIVNTSVIAINLLLCPVVGMLIDKVGRRRCLIVSHQASQQWDRFLLQHRGRGLRRFGAPCCNGAYRCHGR